MKYVILLRGINVGGHRKVPMAQLRVLLESLGHEQVATYIQSGNAIATSARTDVPELVAEIEAKIEREFGFAVTVVVRTPVELEYVLAHNPFLETCTNLAELYVSFLSAQPDADRVSIIDPVQHAPDEFSLGDRVVYLRYARGAGTTKLTNDLLERRLGVRATARNWNTVNKLVQLASNE